VFDIQQVRRSHMGMILARFMASFGIKKSHILRHFIFIDEGSLVQSCYGDVRSDMA
jgi:hypothetical protein